MTRPAGTASAGNPAVAGGHVAAGGSIVVKPGDSLWSIARSLLPAGASNTEIDRKLVEIWDRNAQRIGTNDPNLIFAGQRLIV